MNMLFTLFSTVSVTISSGAQVSPAVAANMKYAFMEISEKFTMQTGYSVTPIYGSSGKIVSQIRSGAPFDMFISSDIGFTDSICVSRLNAGTPKVYAFGKIVLWTMKPYDHSKGVSLLKESIIKTVALGDMKMTVYGPAVRTYLKKMNLWECVYSKAVYGSNITQVAQYIVNGSADVGFCAKSIVLSREMKDQGTWVEIDSTSYDPMPQSAVILKYGEMHHNKITQALYDYLYSLDSREILINYGFGVP